LLRLAWLCLNRIESRRGEKRARKTRTMRYRREGDGEGGRWMGAVAVASPCAAQRRRPAPSRRVRELQDGIRRVREESLIRAMGGEEWPFQAFFLTGPVQTEQHFQPRTVFNPGRTDPAGMAPGTGHSGKTERALTGLGFSVYLTLYFFG
jgi:hypothetical protein